MRVAVHGRRRGLPVAGFARSRAACWWDAGSPVDQIFGTSVKRWLCARISSFHLGVEEITGREARAFLSANHMEPDIAIENFMLQPAD